MALFDGKISLKTSIEEAWKAAQQTLTPAEKIVSSTPNAAFAAMDSVLGYLYIFRTRSNGEIAVRLLIDEAPRVREIFRTYKGSDALDMLATLGSADDAYMQRIEQLGKQRLKHVEEVIDSALNIDLLLDAYPPADKSAAPPKSESKDVSIVPAESMVQSPPAPDWLTGLSSAIPPEGRSNAPKVIASPYAEPIVSDRRQLWWIVGILSVILVIGLVILIMVVSGANADRSYEGQWFSLKLPAGWSKIAPDNRAEVCGGEGACSLIIGKDPYHFVAIYFKIETSATPMTLKDIETGYWFNFQAQHPDYHFNYQNSDTLRGHPAVVIEYVVPRGPDYNHFKRYITVLNPTTTLHVVTYGVSSSQYRDAENSIVQILSILTINS